MNVLIIFLFVCFAVIGLTYGAAALIMNAHKKETKYEKGNEYYSNKYAERMKAKGLL